MLNIKTTNRFNNNYNGSILETINFTITSDGATITGNLQGEASGPLTLAFSDGLTILAADAPGLDIQLLPGTSTVPNKNYVFIPFSTKVLTVNNTGWPLTEHARISEIMLLDATRTAADGALGNRNHNDHIAATDDNGHMLHVSSRLRIEPAKWVSGVALSVAGDGTNDLTFDVTAGIVAQLHEQVFPAIQMSVDDDIHVVNDFTEPYITITNLFDITEDSTGTPIGTNKYFNLVVWGVQNKTGQNSHIFVNLPGGVYTSESGATVDTLKHDNFTIPEEFNGTGFLIGRITFQLKVASWDVVASQDLRGLIPGNIAGSTATPVLSKFSDSAFGIFNVLDDTKELDIDVSGVATGTTRVWTAPDISGTVIIGSKRNLSTKVNDYLLLPADYTILADATSNTVDITLPAAPVQGQVFNIKCINVTFTCTVARNGKNIDGAASDLTLILNESVTLQYDSSFGWSNL